MSLPPDRASESSTKHLRQPTLKGETISSANRSQKRSSVAEPYSMIKKYAAPGDWPPVRGLITRLYVAEGKSLKEVMTIMENEYGFLGTRRMYQIRIAQWGLNKNNKLADMVFVLHKRIRREGLGKQSCFSVHGRVVSNEEVAHYFKRKGGILNAKRLERYPTPPTPPHISYRTPSPEPHEIDYSGSDSLFSEPVQDVIIVSRPARNKTQPAAAQDESIWELERVGAANTPPGYSLSYVPASSITPALSPEPASPIIFGISEELLCSIKSHYEGSFDSGAWITDSDGNCINARTADGMDDLVDFRSNCATAADMVNVKSFKEAGKLLSKACGLIRAMLEAREPRFLDCLLGTYLCLKKDGIPEVLEIIRPFVSAMAETVLEKKHPLRRVCQLFGMLEVDQIHWAIDLSWQCSNAAFEKILGRLHETTIRGNLDYIHWLHEAFDGRGEEMNIRQAEMKIRQMLSECQQAPDKAKLVPRIMLRLANNLTHQLRWEEAEPVALEIVPYARLAGSLQDEKDGLLTAAMSQYKMGKFELAEGTTRRAAAVFPAVRGGTDPRGLECWIRLEIWLREWGRIEDADRLNKDINTWSGIEDDT